MVSRETALPFLVLHRDRHSALADDILVAGAGAEASVPLRLWFSDLSKREQALVLGLDPLGDREECRYLGSVTDVPMGGGSDIPTTWAQP